MDTDSVLSQNKQSKIKTVKKETLQLIDRIKDNLNVDENTYLIVELWKELDCVDLSNENSITMFNTPFKHSEQTLCFLLVQFLIKNGCFDVLEQFKKEFETINGNKQTLCYLKNVIKDNLQFKAIMDDIDNRKYDLLEQFMKNSPVCSSLWFYFSIYKFINSNNEKDSLFILTGEVGKYVKSMVGECKKYLKLLIFKDKIGESADYVEQVLKDLFVQEYSRLKLYNSYSYLPDLLFVGASAFDQLKQFNLSVIDKEENILPVEIKLPKGFNYHSLFVCPVLKSLCVDDNKPVLLSCNHVISSSAANVLSKFGASETFKCPYCPEMCTYSSLLTLDL